MFFSKPPLPTIQEEETLSAALSRHFPKTLYDYLAQKGLMSGDDSYSGQCEYEGQRLSCCFEFIYNDTETPGVTFMLIVGDIFMRFCFADKVWYMNHMTCSIDETVETCCEGAEEFILKIWPELNLDFEDALTNNIRTMDERRASTPEKTEEAIGLLNGLALNLTPVSSVCSTPSK